MEISDNIRGYEILMISKAGTKNHPAYDVLCYPDGGGCIRKLNLTKENAQINFNEDFEFAFLCEIKNEQNEWEYELNIPKRRRIKNIPDFEEQAKVIVDSCPSGMLFPDMLVEHLVFDDDE